MKQTLNLVVLSFIVLSFACSRKKSNEEVLQTVKTDTVQVFGEKPQSVFPGKVKAASEVNLSFRIAGPIAKMYADAGNQVRRGQMLAEMDARDYQIQLSATEAEYKQIKAEAERVMELYEKGSVTPNDYDKANYGLKQITAKYNAHKNALADTRLLAPFDGYIQKRFFDPNETVGAGMPVISMINAGIPEVEINIPASEFINRDKFELFSCTVDIYPDRVFPLDLIGIAQKANLNQLYTVRLKMKESEKPLPSPGMVTLVTIQYKPEKSQSVSIPYSALFEINGASSVWIYHPENQTVSARKVKPSEIHTNGSVVVSEGLTAGEIIVSAGVHVLKEGEKVKLLPPVSPTNIGGLL
ncbi:RND transporter [Bacteroidia bacterium]|nr:RND transporter [Bacteroidia bacterium]